MCIYSVKWVGSVLVVGGVGGRRGWVVGCNTNKGGGGG